MIDPNHEYRPPPRLGVNIDHVATIRQARRTIEPDPVWAASLAELAGADVITVHLREDRRHIQERDVRILRHTVQCPLNLEMAAVDSITAIAVEVKPQQVTLVPERREEITTEGGLDLVKNLERVEKCLQQLHAAGIHTSLFIDTQRYQIDAAKRLNVSAVEFHTGRYADAATEADRYREFQLLVEGVAYANRVGLAAHLGHGLTYQNTARIASIPGVAELNIGHSIVSRAVLVGFERAVREMKELILQAAPR